MLFMVNNITVVGKWIDYPPIHIGKGGEQLDGFLWYSFYSIGYFGDEVHPAKATQAPSGYHLWTGQTAARIDR